MATKGKGEVDGLPLQEVLDARVKRAAETIRDLVTFVLLAVGNRNDGKARLHKSGKIERNMPMTCFKNRNAHRCSSQASARAMCNGGVSMTARRATPSVDQIRRRLQFTSGMAPLRRRSCPLRPRARSSAYREAASCRNTRKSTRLRPKEWPPPTKWFAAASRL